MVKAYIAGVDGPFGYNLAIQLAHTTPTLPRVEETENEDEGQTQAPEEIEETTIQAQPVQKEPFTVTGSFRVDIGENFASNSMNEYLTSPGRMIETGDKQKNAARREAIQKIPIPRKMPKGVSQCVDQTEVEAMERLVMEADIIIVDLITDLAHANWALNLLSKNIDNFVSPKTFIAISTVLTWAKTKGDPDDPEVPIAEDEYRKRKCHPNFKDHLAFEKNVIKYSKMEKFKGYIIAPGLIYHSGDSIFHNYLKNAWHNAPYLPCYGNGENIIPTIHLDDLITITTEVLLTSPEQKYILAIDDSKSSLMEITKSIAETLSNGIVKKLSKEDAFLDKAISQTDYDMLTVNLRLESGFIKEAGLELKYESGLVENIAMFVQEYKDARGLWPIKVVIHGPPASGKTLFAKQIAEHYKLHYLEPDEIVSQAISGLETRVTNPIKRVDDDENDVEEDKELLNEIRETLKNNNGKLPPRLAVTFIRDRIRSMPCRNQGYVLDGYPSNMDEANDLLRPIDEEARDDKSAPIIDELIAPEYVFTIDMPDSLIKQRIMKLPETPGSAVKYSEEVITKRLEEFRKANTDEITVLNFFDELEITPIVLQCDINDSSQIMAQIKEEIGLPRNYGKSLGEISVEKKEEEVKRRKAVEKLQEERAAREKEEQDRHQKAMKEWVKQQERDVLEVQSEPLRNYLVKYVMPTLTAGLIEVAKVRPEDPIDYLAEFLFKQNPENEAEN